MIAAFEALNADVSRSALTSSVRRRRELLCITPRGCPEEFSSAPALCSLCSSPGRYNVIVLKRGFKVSSFGSGNSVKLPGASVDKPNVYEFDGTTYDEIFADLKSKDIHLYTQNGLLNMLDRNRRIKRFPQKFQRCTEQFDVILCLEERVYDQILDDLHTRPTLSGDSVHVINMDIQDNHEEATIGAFFVVELCTMLENCDDLDNEIDEVIAQFESKHPDRNIMHTICFY
ncbi:Ssu72-like protein [Aphelenchoides avenae]|nr:Ssu72-like protein [Aphelenchus avenae]